MDTRPCAEGPQRARWLRRLRTASWYGPAVLIAADEPGPFEVSEGQANSPFVIVCDHAGRRIPRSLAGLGLPEHELTRHIAWDIGALELARKLARSLGAWLIAQNYSRLVIDCNRPLDRPDSIARTSEDTLIPGNQAVSAEAARKRAAEIFEPYHRRIRQELDARRASGQRTLLVFLHSFTPSFRGVSRAWHAGVLYHQDARLALPVLEGLQSEAALHVGENQPYAASVLTDYGLVEHAEKRGLPYVELEVRQDLLEGDPALTVWAERLARVLLGASRLVVD
jgi:predicted N-formylglutamate amidohydrolase